MANPNLLSATTISGITTFLELSTSSQTLVTNAAASGKVMRIGGVTVANIDGTNAADVTVKLHNAAAGAGTSFSLFQTVSVPGSFSTRTMAATGLATSSTCQIRFTVARPLPPRWQQAI